MLKRPIANFENIRLQHIVQMMYIKLLILPVELNGTLNSIIFSSVISLVIVFEWITRGG